MMCGYGGFGGGHMMSMFFMLIVLFGAMYFFRRGNFCESRRDGGKSDAALVSEIESLRREVEELKQQQGAK